MQWDMDSRTIIMDVDARYLFKGILSKYLDVGILINKFNKGKIVLTNDELAVLHHVLVDAINDCADDEVSFISGFLDNTN